MSLLETCPDCAVKAGQKHLADCDIERCSVCGLQFTSCRCAEHDKGFARWDGIYPGEAQCLALGFTTEAGMPDLNKLYSEGLYQIFFVKPI